MEFLYLSVLFAGYSVVYSWDTNGEYAKRQLVPQPRIGRSYNEGKRQGLIPSPRVGRSSAYNGIANSIDCKLNAESCNKLMEYKNLHEVHEGIPLLRIPPYANRKRSTSLDEEYSNDKYIDDFELNKTLRSNPWDLEVEEDFFQRNTRQLIPSPRMGRSGNTYKNELISGLDSANYDEFDPIDLQLRAAIIPRLGKRMSYKNSDQLSDFDEQYKRASAFIPRIGRAAFTPRIGKKSAFVPRIGRSADNVSN